MPLREATPADIEAMHAVRLSVRENVLSDPTRVLLHHYREMLDEHGKGWVFEDATQVLGFAIADHSRRNIWALFVAPGFEQRASAAPCSTKWSTGFSNKAKSRSG